MQFIHSFFNLFDKNTHVSIADNYILSQGKKVMKILNTPKKHSHNLSIQRMKKNKLFDHKLQIDINLNNLKSLVNYDRNLITLHLKKHNELDLNFKHINLLKQTSLKNIKKYLTNVSYLDNNHIKIDKTMLNISNLETVPFCLNQSHFKFIIVSGSFRSNLGNIAELFNDIIVITPQKLKNLALMHFEPEIIKHDFTNLCSYKTMVIIDYLTDSITIPKNIENIIVFHPLTIDKTTISKYKDMFFENMGKQNDLLKHIYCLPQKSTKRVKVNTFKFNVTEKKMFSKLSTQKKRFNYSYLSDSFYTDFKPINSDNTCSICLDTIEEKNHALTKCKHSFCKKCILNSLNYSNSCPICRQVLSKQDVYIESKKLQYLLKHSDPKSLIICNDFQTTKYLKKKMNQSSVEYEKFVYSKSLENFTNIFILESNQYLKDFILGSSKKPKVHVLLNIK